MDENEKKEPETAQEPPKPEDYSRYMGTLNRIYRRNNNPQRKKLGDGITSLKKGQQPAEQRVEHENVRKKGGRGLPPLRRIRAKKTAASLLWREEPSS